MRPGYILLGFLLTVVVSMALGRLALTRLKLRIYHQEVPVFSFLLGSAILSQIVFLFAAAQLIYKGVFLVTGLVAIFLAWRAPKLNFPALPPLPARWWVPLAILAVPFVALYVSNAMAPEHSPDGSSYHLGLVGRYYRGHGFSRITDSLYASLSQGMEMLFLYAYAFGRHSAAAMVHFAFLLALPWLMICYGRRFGVAVPAMCAAALAFFSPVAGIDGTSAYNDVAVAAVVFGVFYLIRIWDRERAMGLLVAAGMLAGFAYGIKYTAFFAAIYAAGYVFWRLRKSPRDLRRSLAALAVACALWVAPWMIKNAIIAGNPVSPFFNSAFPNPHVKIAFEREFRESLRNYSGLRSHWDIPLEVTVRGQVLGGLVGPIFLLAPAGLLALRHPVGGAILTAGAIFALPYAANVGTRFLIPGLPFAALALAIGVARWRQILFLLVLLHAIASWPDVLKQYCSQWAWRLDRIRYPQALRLESEEGFLVRTWPGYSNARMIERVVPPEGRVLTFSPTSEAYTNRRVTVVYQSAEGSDLGGIQWTPLIPERQPTRRIDFDLNAASLTRLRVRQTARHERDLWAISEVRLYAGHRERPRSGSWRLRAHPFPWTVQDAFDNSPVTSWNSGEPLFPGMFVEVDLTVPTRVDQVTLEMPATGLASRVVLDFEQAGRWTSGIEGREIEAPPPIGLRREAAEVLYERGVTHLLIHNDDYYADDYAKRIDDWGLTLAGETAYAKLYAIQPPKEAIP